MSKEKEGGSNRRGGGNTLCLPTVLSLLNKMNFVTKTLDGAGQCPVSSDYNLMDHTKIKSGYCPAKCTRSVFFHVVIVNVMYV